MIPSIDSVEKLIKLFEYVILVLRRKDLIARSVHKHNVDVVSAASPINADLDYVIRINSIVSFRIRIIIASSY